MAGDFGALGIRRELVETLRMSGIKEPTPVQEQAIGPLLAGQDVIAQAQTGTGKTLAFLLPIMERVNPQNPLVQTVILTPTRELALQISTTAKGLAAKVGAGVLAIYGGQDVERQITKLAGAVQVVVATPGRLLDHVRRGTLRLDKVRMVVLDEADQMLHMGFLDEVEDAMSAMARERQTVLCSATMPAKVRDLARAYMKSPLEIRVQAKQITLEQIEQVVVETTEPQKVDTLCQKLNEANPYLALIFCKSKVRAGQLATALIQRGYNVDEMHGDLSQAKREQVMKRFRQAKTQYLVCTDIAARGLDVEGVTHVFNYDIPHDAETYIHRIGRTGRAGESGTAVTLVTPPERDYLRLIEEGIAESLARMNAEGRALPPLAQRQRRAKPAAGAVAAQPRRGVAKGAASGDKPIRGRAQAAAARARGVKLKSAGGKGGRP